MSYELQQASTKMCLSTEEEIVSHTHHPQAVCKSHVSHVTIICVYVRVCMYIVYVCVHAYGFCRKV